MLDVQKVNGKVVKVSAAAEELGVEFVDIASSGRGGDLFDDEWRTAAIDEFFEKVADELKLELFMYVMEDMDKEGWMVKDIAILAELCGVKECVVVF